MGTLGLPGVNLPSLTTEAETMADSLSAPMRDIYKRKEDAMKPVREKMLKETENMVNQPPPEQKSLPEYQAPKLNKKVFTGFLIAATIFGTLASIKSKKPLTTALTAFSGFVEGFTKGNQLQMEKAYNEYKINLDRALIENENAQKLYNAAYKKHGDNIELLKLEIGDIARQFDDELMTDAARRGDFKFMLGYIQDMQKMNLEMQRHKERIGAEYQKIELSRQRLNQPKTDEGTGSKLYSDFLAEKGLPFSTQPNYLTPEQRKEWAVYKEKYASSDEPGYEFVIDPKTGKPVFRPKQAKSDANGAAETLENDPMGLR